MVESLKMKADEGKTVESDKRSKASGVQRHANDAAGDSDMVMAVTPSEIDLESPEWYLNRELTWLAFNRRVLREAQDERNPLLERIKFLSIISSNLDEFFMKRIGGLKQQIGARVRELTVDGRSPEQQYGLNRRSGLQG